MVSSASVIYPESGGCRASHGAGDGNSDFIIPAATWCLFTGRCSQGLFKLQALYFTRFSGYSFLILFFRETPSQNT